MDRDRLLVLGLSEPTLTMIFDNLASAGCFPRVHVVDNLARTDLMPFEDPRFTITRSSESTHPDGPSNAFLGVNKPATKVAVAALFAHLGLAYTTIVHAAAAVAHTASLAPGVLVNSLVSIAGFADLGEFVSVNRNATIGHHTRLDPYCTVNPGANIAGYVRIGARTLIGIGASVVDGVTIGADTIVGAGSVVTKDLPSGVVAHGNPCRVVRHLPPRAS
jgi:sugar O-acyltransferase (sialic acid O-acetyltransferase NeuD family)